MIRILVATVVLGLTGCMSPDAYSGNQICARTAGCVSSFSSAGYGPIQAQAVAPTNAGALQPQK